MKKTRKRLFAFSGLFVLVAQVLVMALCSIPAIAVTREETNRTLFNNEHGSATISYEEMESGGLNWTINLQKAAHDTATRFMVAMTADGQAIMPENVQTVMQSAPEISFTAGNGEGLMLAGLQEGAAGSGAGSAVITYQTSGNYGQMAVVPKLVTVGDTVSDLLAGNPGVVYDIPVKEEPSATEEAVTGELPLNDGQTATTETTEADAVEATTDSQDAEITESTTESTATDEATEVTETTDSSETAESTTEDSTATTESSSEAEDETGDVSEATEVSDEANKNAEEEFSGVIPTASAYTSLEFLKNWVGVPENATEEEKTVYLQLMRRPKGSEEDYQPYLEEEYDTLVYPDKVKEWHNLPVGEDPGYEYTVKEVPSSYYTTKQNWDKPNESTINSLTTVSNNSGLDWGTGKDPSYFIAREQGGKRWVIWTADHIPEDQRDDFAAAIAGTTADKTQPHQDFSGIKDYSADNILWIEGSVKDAWGVTTSVQYTEDGIELTVSFGEKSDWTQFMYGSSSTRSVNATNTYVKPTDITVKKLWDDNQNLFITRNEDVRLALQVYQYNSDTKTWEWVDVQDKFLDIKAGSTEESLEQTFTVPTKTSDGSDGFVDAQYRVIEKVKDSDGNFTGNRVYGYAAPTPTNPQAGDYSVTNTLLKTALSFTKVDGQGNPLGEVTFDLSRDGMENDPWPSVTTSEDGKVNFSDLPVGDYTLTETGTAPGYELPVAPENSWGFTVTDTNGTEKGMNIVWDEGENPFGDKNITNNGKIVNNLKPFDFTVNKVDDLGVKLIGAEFTLTGPDDYKQVITSTEENRLSSFTFTDLVAPKEGTNTYTLTETKAPDGYAKLANPIIITIGYNDEGKLIITVDGKEVKPSLNENSGHNTFSYDVTNKALVPLPATGGPGTLLFFVMGILAIAVTGIYFVSRQKQEVA